MNFSVSLFRWFGTRRGVLGLCLVLATSLALGCYIATTFLAPPSPTYAPDFGKAQWLTADGTQAVVYLRKEIYLAGQPRHSWLLAAGPDSFNVYVNNTKLPGATGGLGTGYQSPGVPTALVDINPYLTIGVNTIAVTATTSHYAYPGCAIVRAHIEQDMANLDVYSDASWRGSPYPSVLKNLVAWTDPTLDDTQWPFAHAIQFPDTAFLQPLPLPPWLFDRRMQAHWIASLSRLPSRVVFSTDFNLPLGAHDSWLQVSSFGKNQVLVNGHLVADSSEQPEIVDSNQDKKVHFYWIQPWLKLGHNQINTRVDDMHESPALLEQINFLTAGGTPAVVASNGGWMTQGEVGAPTHALDLGSLDPGTLTDPVFPAAPAPYSSAVVTGQFLAILFFTLVLAALFVAVHLFAAHYFERQGLGIPGQALSTDAILHLPILIGVVLLTLLSYDTHLRPETALATGWSWGLLAFWFGLRWLAARQLKEEHRRPPVAATPRPAPWYEGQLTTSFTLILGGITFLAFVLRVYSINLFDLDQDEILMNFCAQGVLERGYPSVNNHGLVLRLTTYELLPFPMALSGLIFGFHGWSMRIPAMLFGTFTAWNVGRMSRELFSPFVGLVTALVYAILPLEVYFAAHCIHPQQTQFFQLLCIWSFYRANREVGVFDAHHFYRACIYFVCGYYSWEGSAFVLPGLAVAMIFLHPGKFWWLRQFHLYAGIFLVSTAVIVQLVYRATKAPAYIAVGFGLSDLSPRAVFLEQTGHTDYYMSGIILSQCHLLLDLGLLLGLLFVARDRPLRYVVLLFCTLLFGYSNFLPVYTDRYFYFYQVLLVMGGCAGFCKALQVLLQLAGELPLLVVRRIAWWSTAAAIALLVCVSGNIGFRLVGTTLLPEDSSTRYGMYWSEARQACEYVASHLQPGDFVAGTYNYSYYYFTGKWVDFTVNQYDSQLAVFTPNDRGYGDYQNIYVRKRSFLNERDFYKVFSQCKRLWFISVKPESGGPDYINSLNDFVSQRSRVVYAGYDVYLYLSEGMPTKEGEGLPDRGIPVSALPKVDPATTTNSASAGTTTAGETQTARNTGPP